MCSRGGRRRARAEARADGGAHRRGAGVASGACDVGDEPLFLGTELKDSVVQAQDLILQARDSRISSDRERVLPLVRLETLLDRLELLLDLLGLLFELLELLLDRLELLLLLRSVVRCACNRKRSARAGVSAQGEGRAERAERRAERRAYRPPSPPALRFSTTDAACLLWGTGGSTPPPNTTIPI
jgi:hypothetical protein